MRILLLSSIFALGAPVFAITCPPGSTCWTWTFTGSTAPGSTGTFTASESTTATNLSGNYSVVPGTGFTSMTGITCSGGGCPVPGSLVGALIPGAGMVIQPVLSSEQQPIFNILTGSCPTGTVTGSFIPTQWPAGGAGVDTSSPGQAGFGSGVWDMSTNPVTLRILSRRNLVTFAELGGGVLSHDTCGTTGPGEVNLSGQGDQGGVLAWLPNNIGFLFRSLSNHTFWFVSQQTVDYTSILYGKYAGFSFDPSGAANVKPVNLSVVSTGTTGSGNALSDVVAGTSDASYLRTFTIPSAAGLVNGVTYPAGGGLNFPFAGIVTGTISDGTHLGNLSCLVLPGGNASSQSALFCSGQSPAKNSLPYNLVVVMNTGAPGGGDSTFGSSGVVQSHLFSGGADEVVNDVVPQRDGKVLLLGYANGSSGTPTPMVARVGVDGNLDPSFGTNGTVQTPLAVSASDQKFLKGVLQSNGALVAVGYSTVGGKTQSAAVRYTASGALDTTFASTGIWSGAFGTDNALNDVRLQTDGSVVAAGWMVDKNTDKKQFLVLRLTTGGALDSAFGKNGFVQHAVGLTSSPAAASALAIQFDGKIVAAGQCSRNTTGVDFCASRFLSTGTVDDKFGSGATKGNVFMAFSSGNASDTCTGVQVQADGKIVLGGYTQVSANANPFQNNNDFAMVRFLPVGDIDTTFNNTGAVVTPIGNGNDLAQGLQIQFDGKIVLAGSCANNAFTAWQYCAYRSNADGSTDSTFGTGGKLTGQARGNSSQLNGFRLGQDGRIFFAGEVLNNSVWDTLVMRYWP